MRDAIIEWLKTFVLILAISVILAVFSVLARDIIHPLAGAIVVLVGIMFASILLALYLDERWSEEK